LVEIIHGTLGVAEVVEGEGAFHGGELGKQRGTELGSVFTGFGDKAFGQTGALDASQGKGRSTFSECCEKPVESPMGSSSPSFALLSAPSAPPRFV
jgi:hypothetical protein